MKLATQQQLDRAYQFACTLLKQGPVDWVCEKWAEPRTNPQNAYLWAAVYAPLVEKCGFDAESWHEFFCTAYFGPVHSVKPSGETVTTPKRTTTRNEAGKRDVLKGKAFTDFVTFVEAECAERGVFIVEEWEDKAE